MWEKDQLQELAKSIPHWYRQDHRSLPWREDRDPYHIWLSEIMLQQTRVGAVKGYYTRFLEKLPTVEMLANADEELLHKLWEGLGYYSRVRNLKKAAVCIMTEFDGVFPNCHEDILKLPGIGPYTAGAIASIAFGAPTPAVDGNVLRVMARLGNDDRPVDTPLFKKEVTEALAEVYPADAGDFTQGLMELGATLCGPDKAPMCDLCPCRNFCKGKHRAAELPVRLPKKDRRIEKRTVFILTDEEAGLALCKRPDSGLLAGLWELPNVEGFLDINQAMEFLRMEGIEPIEIEKRIHKKHIFTHIQWDMRGYYIRVHKNDKFKWFVSDSPALPTAFKQFIDT